MTLRAGKLPASMLAGLLARIDHRDPRVLLGPGIGRDAAVIDIGHGRVLVAKTDPVTFAADDIGWYAVNVNANDIACMGARPAWFLATALLPTGADDDLPERIFGQLARACSALDVELVGGHTEVTLGIDRPIVVGAMLGEAARHEIVTGENVQAGDVVLMSKGIAIEGTALLAREAAADLVAHGVDQATIARAADLLYDPGISVVRDASDLCSLGRPKLMHDPTEGGIATALHEMAGAAGRTLRIDLGAIPILDETRAVCRALALDPLGLLASGALLAIVGDAHAAALISREDPEIGRWRAVGSVELGPARVILAANSAPLPVFPRDELARFLDDTATGQRAR